MTVAKTDTMTSSSNNEEPKIIILTGNMAAGKSTTAQALAERLPRSVHLRGDCFRRAIINGRADMGLDLSYEAKEQLELRYELAAQVAKCYAENNFTVVYQDVILGEALEKLEIRFHPFKPAIIVLAPSADAIELRDRGRGKTGYRDRRMIDAFDSVLHEQTPRLGYWLDTSELTIGEVVEHILAHLNLEVLRPL